MSIYAEPGRRELAERLQETLELLSRGHTNKTAARAMRHADGSSLSPGTVAAYRRSLLYKFNAKNTPELISKAYSSGALRALAIFASLLLPLETIVSPEDAVASMRYRSSRARRNRRGSAGSGFGLSLEQIIEPGFEAETLFAFWDPDSNSFTFSVLESAG